MEEPAEIVFNLQEEILGLTKENGDKEISILCGYWDKLIAKTKDLGKDLLKYDLRKMSKDECDEYFKPLLNLIYSTGIYFVNHKSGGKKTLKHSELFLIILLDRAVAIMASEHKNNHRRWALLIAFFCQNW